MNSLRTLTKWLLVAMLLVYLGNLGLMIATAHEWVVDYRAASKKAEHIVQMERALIICLNGGTLQTDAGAITCGPARSGGVR